MGAIGRLAVPGLGIFCSAAAGLWFRRYRRTNILPALWKVAAGALLAARVAFVLQQRDSYSGNPLALLDLADGGFSATAGLFAAFVLGAELTRHAAAPARRALLISSLLGITAWVGATIATLDFAPARTTVPLLQVRRLDGSAVQLRTFTSKPMVVNLWATWCPPCRREMPVLRDAQRRHPEIAFVFVNQGESPAAIRDYLGQERLQIDNVFSDPAGALGQDTGSFAFPTTLFFDGQGVLFMRQVGALNAAGLDERLAMLKKAQRR